MYCIRLVSCSSLLLAASLAGAMDRGLVPGGGGWVSGGIGAEERAQLDVELASHTLWIRTAAKRSGEYLADATVVITDKHGARIFERALDGPWLLVDLPAGSYTVQVRYADQIERQSATVRSKADRRQMVFYFEVPADVLPPGERGPG